MSYQIYYDCKLIQYKNKFMVDMTTGANNVSERSSTTGRWRKERNRNLTSLGMGKLFFTKEEILAYVKDTANDEYEDTKNSPYGGDNNLTFEEFSKGYGWYVSIALHPKHTTKTTFDMYNNFFLKAFKKVTVYKEGVFIPPYWNGKESIFINSDNIEEYYQKSFSK